MSLEKERAWHTLDIAESYAVLETGAGGLKSEEAARRLAHYGRNEIESAARVSKQKILWAQIKNPRGRKLGDGFEALAEFPGGGAVSVAGGMPGKT